MSSGHAGALRRRVLLSGTMLAAAVVGYGRRAYGQCAPTVAPNYQCSGANVLPQSILNADNASVSTVAGFSVNTAAGNAITITGQGAMSYTDTDASPLSAAAYTALYVRSITDDGATPGSVTIATNGALSGSRGIDARNYGAGAVTISANGDVTSTGYGIFARNLNSGTALSVTTGAGTTVSGGSFGIYTRNFGTGAVTITANGNVTGTNFDGIFALSNGNGLSVTTGAGTLVSGDDRGIFATNFGTGAVTITANGNVTATSGSGYGIYARNNGTDLSVTTGAGTTVSGGNKGIFASSSGTGALTITANGDVTGTSGSGYGIYARNSVNGTDLTVTTGAGKTASGGTNGINVRSFGTDTLTITANGDVTGTSGAGIFAQNNVNGTDLSVTTATGTTSGGTNGIFAQNYGTGALTVTANGNVTGTSNRGINAYNSGAGTNLTVTTGAGTAVSGGNFGIFADNQGMGAVTITVNGNVTGTNSNGIFAYNSGAGTDLTVTTAAGTTVSGGTDGIFARNNGTGALAVTVAATSTVSGTSGFGIQALGRPATVTVAGTVTGGAGGAIRFDQVTGFANRLELVTGAVINGSVAGGTATDTLGLSGTSSGSFNVGQLVSFEAGEKTGGGSWTLTGSNAGITAFSVGGGALFANGSLSNAAFTVNGGTLGGIGTVGNTTIMSGGALAPGNSIGTLTVNGSLTFNGGATYAVEVSPTAADRTNVSGTATLTGATVQAIALPGSFRAQTYTILNATGGLGGTQFAGITTSGSFAPGARNPHLTYDANNVYLLLDPGTIALPLGTGGNQSNAAGTINAAVERGATPPAGFDVLLNMSGTQLSNALGQASGQPGASTAQAGFATTGQFINGVFDGAFGDGPGQGGATGFAQEEDNANAYAGRRKLSREVKDAYAAVTPRDRRAPSFEQRWAVWASAYGGNSRVNGDTAAGTNTTTNRVFGAVAGATYHFTPDTQAGFSLGGAGSRFDIANNFGGGRAEMFNAAVYAKHNWGAAYVAGLVGYSWQDTTTDRIVTIAGVDRLHASFQAQALATRLEGGWRYAAPMVGITPYAALQTTTFYLPSYGETATSGSNTFALNYASKSVTATRSELGAKFDKATPVQGGVFTLKARAAWAHDWNTDRSAIATFQTLPGATFTTNGALPAADAALASLGAEMKWHNGWTVAGRFDGEFSNVSRSYAGKGVVRYSW